MALLAAGGLLLAWYRRRRHPAVALTCLGFAALAVPCLGWTEMPTWPVDRYSYLVHLVLVGGGAGWLLHRAGNARVRRLLAFGVPVLVVGFAVAARHQAMIWRNSPSLFTSMERNPHFADDPLQQAHVYVMWANDELASGRQGRAVELFDRAEHVYLSEIAVSVGRQDYRAALGLMANLEHFFPLTPPMRREKGAWLLRLGRTPEAIRELQAAQQAMPGDARTKSLLEEAEK
jgi:hypothetical protein